MQAILDRIISDIDTIRQDDDFSDIMEIQTDTKLGDPGLVLIQEYPYIYIEPIQDVPAMETIGVVGYDVRALGIRICIVINASDYFDPTVNEVPGMRQLVLASGFIRDFYRRLDNKTLNRTPGIRKVSVLGVEYRPEIRGDVYVSMATITLEIEKRYQHER